MKKILEELHVEEFHHIVRRKGLRLSDLQTALRILEQRIENGDLQEFWEHFFFFEAWRSVAIGAGKQQFHFPTLDANALVMTGFYHPLLKDPVLNDLRVQANLVVLTGPNMAGKSTLLKTIGLCVYLGHLGLPVPAKSCEMPYFEFLSVSIQLKDDLQSGYSHFMSEVKVLKAVLLEAGRSKRCFAVFDELFRGTNTEDALAISYETIEGLSRFPGCCFFISTHLFQLKEKVEANNTQRYYLECLLTDNHPTFTYRLKAGWSDLRIGQALFEREGMHKLLRPDKY